MQTTVVVFHRGGLARYLVNIGADGMYEASLMRYDGKPLFAPPPRLTFSENIPAKGEAHAALMEELFRIVKKRFENPQPAGPNLQAS